MGKTGRGGTKYIDEYFASILATYDATKKLNQEGIDARVGVLKKESATKASTLELELLRLCSADDDLPMRNDPTARLSSLLIEQSDRS
jgi:hypothetical protein